MELQLIQNKIFEIRGHKIMLDFDLAELYEVQTKVLNQAVKRNLQRFPDDFMYRLTIEEWEIMRSQSVTAYPIKRNVSATPFAFTEQGLAKLSGVLTSEKAISVNIAIMRAFVLIRQYALNYNELSVQLKEIEGRFADVYQALKYLLEKDKLQVDQSLRKRIGYTPEPEIV